MKRRPLPKREIRELNQVLPDFRLDAKATVEIVEDARGTIILQNGEPTLFSYQGRWLPTLQTLNKNNPLKKITVDMGAIPHICSGADIMRPGIKAIEEGVARDFPVAVVDERYGKILAVGMALFDSEEMKRMEKGKAIKNIHYVGDWVWNFARPQ